MPGEANDQPPFGWPVSAPLTQAFGGPHMGVDLGTPTGTSAGASASGAVTSAGWNDGGYGNRVVLDHGNSWETTYNHLDRIDVQVGQLVGRGQPIGATGSTGRSTGPHLHFEIRHNGQFLDPVATIGTDPATSAPMDAESAAGSTAGFTLPGPLGAAQAFFERLSDPTLWRRVLSIVVGFAAVGLGLAVLTRSAWAPAVGAVTGGPTGAVVGARLAEAV